MGLSLSGDLRWQATAILALQEVFFVFFCFFMQYVVSIIKSCINAVAGVPFFFFFFAFNAASIQVRLLCEGGLYAMF